MLSSDRTPMPSLDEIADWMEQNGVQKLTLNKIESRKELKIEASMFSRVAISERCRD